MNRTNSKASDWSDIVKVIKGSVDSITRLMTHRVLGKKYPSTIDIYFESGEESPRRTVYHLNETYLEIVKLGDYNFDKRRFELEESQEFVYFDSKKKRALICNYIDTLAKTSKHYNRTVHGITADFPHNCPYIN